ncbi:hypothetical protein [Calorimonas adulescens]|uniref:Uncharacterized protein n=1 Tax=Calorimonas adulescens TaxID=2606906 RepID=A0A5D8QDC2_9THEO|nr:hypothetical protein [Calorimonas adulescens]TZE82144.1 hypothetical protein FWJ32_06545 [Calorimonas adulescens]
MGPVSDVNYSFFKFLLIYSVLTSEVYSNAIYGAGDILALSTRINYLTELPGDNNNGINGIMLMTLLVVFSIKDKEVYKSLNEACNTLFWIGVLKKFTPSLSSGV